MHGFSRDLFTDGVSFLAAFIRTPFTPDDLTFLLEAIFAIAELLKAAKEEPKTPSTQLVSTLTRSRLIFDGLFKVIIPHQNEMSSPDAGIDIPEPYSSLKGIGRKSSIKAAYRNFLIDHLRGELNVEKDTIDIMAQTFSSLSIPSDKIEVFRSLLWDSGKVLGAYLRPPDELTKLKAIEKDILKDDTGIALGLFFKYVAAVTSQTHPYERLGNLMNLPKGINIRNFIGIPFAAVNASSFRASAEALCHYLYRKKHNIDPPDIPAQQLTSTLTNNEISYFEMGKKVFQIISRGDRD